MKKSYLFLVLVIIVFSGSLSCEKNNDEDDAEEFFVVSNLASASLSFINPETKAVESSLSIPSASLYYIAYLPTTDKLYVTDAGNSAVQIIDAGTRTKTAAVPVAAGTIMHLTAARKNNRVWIVNNTAKTITEINADNNSVAYTLQLADTPHDIAVNDNGTKIYVSVNKSGTWNIEAYTVGTYQLADSRSFGSNWLHLAYSDVNNKLYAADQGTGTFWALDPANLKATAPGVPVPGAHGLILSNDQKFSYVSSITENKIYVYNNSTNAVVNQIAASVTPNAHNIAINKDNDWLLATHSGATSTAVSGYSVSNATLAPASNLTVGTNPQGITYYTR